MKVLKFQQGGAAPEGAALEAQGGAPAQAGPEEQLAQMAQQIIQQLGPDAAAMLAQMLVQMLQGQQGQEGGGGEQPQQPTYQRKGGKLVMIGRR